MSENLSWARKYRPTTFENYLGNERLKYEVQALLGVGKLPQTLLLSGSHGVGKTTLARLIAKSLLCANPVEGKPCGTCYNCGRLTDDYILNGNVPNDISVFDYNISKLNRTEDTERIVENMQARSFDGTKRVFVLDEMQVASQQAQTRFLKIAEEPIENLYIIMCTTNPEKLLKPLKSRFLEYTVKKPSTLDLATHLEEICVKEGVNFSKAGLKLLVNKIGRNPREVLNRAEIISNTGELSRNNIAEKMDVIAESLYMDFLQACRKNNISSVARVAFTLEENNLEYGNFIEGFGDFLANLIDIASLVKTDIYSDTEIKSYKRVISSLTNEQIVGLLRITREHHFLRDDKFILYSFATEIMRLFDETHEDETLVVAKETKPQVPEVSEAVVETKYRDLTDKMSEQDTVEHEVKFVDTNELLDIFNGNSVDL